MRERRRDRPTESPSAITADFCTPSPYLPRPTWSLPNSPSVPAAPPTAAAPSVVRFPVGATRARPKREPPVPPAPSTAAPSAVSCCRAFGERTLCGKRR